MSEHKYGNTQIPIYLDFEKEVFVMSWNYDGTYDVSDGRESFYKIPESRLSYTNPALMLERIAVLEKESEHRGVVIANLQKELGKSKREETSCVIGGVQHYRCPCRCGKYFTALEIVKHFANKIP